MTTRQMHMLERCRDPRAFSDEARKAVSRAFAAAEHAGHPAAMPADLLLALLEERSLPSDCLPGLGLDPADIAAKLRGPLPVTPPADRPAAGLPADPSLEKVFNLALEEARSRGDSLAGPLDLLLAISKLKEDPAAKLLRKVGATPKAIARAFTLLLYTRDLTARARRGELRPVFGRNAEMGEVIGALAQAIGARALDRDIPSDPLLIGEPGTGKSAIVRGIALQIADGSAPAPLDGCKLVSLDWDAIRLSTQADDRTCQRIRAVVKACRDENKGSDIVTACFIDDLPEIFEAQAPGAMREVLEYILEPPPDSGDLPCIWATTPDSYVKLACSFGLARQRFVPVRVEPTSDSSTMAIARSLKPAFEKRHSVQYGDDLFDVQILPTWARHVFPDLQLPGAAVELLEKAGEKAWEDVPHLPRLARMLEESFEQVKGLCDGMHESLRRSGRAGYDPIETHLGAIDALGEQLRKRFDPESMTRRHVNANHLAKIARDERGVDDPNDHDDIKDYPADKMIENLTEDLTADARAGKLAPFIGRDKAITGLADILCGTTTSNAVLIGEPGTGKTAIVHGLAQRIASGNVPEPLKGATILSITTTRLQDSCWKWGKIERRVKCLVDQIGTERGKSGKPIIVFIDELHSVIGASSSEQHVLGLNDMLKPHLESGRLVCIGATTTDEYRKHIEGKDPAFARRFQVVQVEPLSVSESIEVLRLGYKEPFEKSHGVVYEDDALVAAVKLSDRYINDRLLPHKAIELADTAGTIAAREEAPEVTAERVARLVSERTGIPVSEPRQVEADSLLGMAEALSEKVIGQPAAVDAVSKAILRNRAGLGDPDRPIGSFLFLGPTGVGKTELARALAEKLFGSREAMIRIDMSEYMETHAVARMTGASPGYSGNSAGGQLTELVRRSPHSVILLDEIEKAHPDLLNILLQVLDDGRLTDGKGRTASFKNAVIVMTSNAGSQDRLGKPPVGFSDGSPAGPGKEQVRDVLLQSFRPEFLNRVDEIVFFNNLEPEQLERIVELLLEPLKARLAEQRGIQLAVTKAAKSLLLDEGFDRQFGARPIKRAIQRLIQDPLAEAILEKRFGEGDTIRVDRDGNKMSFKKSQGKRRRR